MSDETDKTPEPDSKSFNLVTVRTYSLLLQADLARMVLEGQGIPVFFVNDKLFMQTGYSPDIEVQVPDVLVEHATEILSAELSKGFYRTTQKSKVLEWLCPSCGEKVPNNFDVCWNCQNEKQ